MQQPLFNKGIQFLRFIIIIVLSIIFLLAVTAVFAQNDKAIGITVKPYRSNGIYRTTDKRIGFFIKLKNNSAKTQQGNILIEVKNSYSQRVFNQQIGFSIGPGESFYKEADIENTYFKPGFYYTSLVIKTATFNTTSLQVFAMEPEKMQPSCWRPNDFKQFWNQARNQLYQVNPNYQVIRRGDVATRSHEVYVVEFMASNNTKIRGWLTIPKGRGKFPVLYKMPDYVKAAVPEMQSDFAVFSLDIRGVGMSADLATVDSAAYLTAGMANRSSYIFKDAFLDVLRGLDFIFEYKFLNLDTSKVVIKGEKQGAALAAAVTALSSHTIKGLIMLQPTLVDVRTLFAVNENLAEAAWPVNQFKNFLNQSKTSEGAFFKTWDYFDPLSFAADIRCPVLIGTLLKSNSSPPQCAYNFYNQVLTPKREVYVCIDNENNIDKGYYVYENNWIREMLRIPN